MTKDWDLVKEDIVGLIRSGASLERVRQELARDRQFQASVRSYRKKLKQWQLTRTSQFEAQRAEQSSIAGPTIPDIRNDTSVDGQASTCPSHAFISGNPVSPAATSTTLRASHPPGGASSCANMARLSPNNAMHVDRHASDASSVTLMDGVTPTAPEFSWIDAAYDQIDNAQSGADVKNVLHGIYAQYQDCITTLLQYTIEKQNFYASDCILDYLLNTASPTESTATGASKALESAIRLHRRDVAELLLERGASVKGLSGSTWQPLHSVAAYSLCPSTCRALLRYGADVNAHQSERDLPATPLGIAVKRALSLPIGPEKDKVSAMIQAMLAHGADCNANAAKDGSAVIRFVCQWKQWNDQGKTTYQVDFLIGQYIRADCNPLCRFPGSCCDYCTQVASFVFAHTTEGLGILLIESSNMKTHGKGLADLIISPCKNRSVPRDTGTDASSINLLRLLLNRLDGLETSWQNDLIYEVLERSPDEDKVRLLRTLMDDYGIRVSHRSQALTKLSLISDDKLRLQVAEVLFQPGKGLATSKMFSDFVTDHVDPMTTSPGSASSPYEEIRDGPNRGYLDALGLRTMTASAEEVERIMQCFVHVATSAMLRGPSFQDYHVFVERERLHVTAARLRQHYRLPPIMVSSDYLCESRDSGSLGDGLSSWNGLSPGGLKPASMNGRRHSAASIIVPRTG